MRTAVTIICLLVSSQAFTQVLPTRYKPPFYPKQLPLPSMLITQVQPIPQTFYAQHLGFFCKQELKLQQQRIPVTFRLGSMDYCNRLEQKPGYK